MNLNMFFHENPRFLVIDDDEDDQFIITSYLKQLYDAATVDCATGYHDAIEKIRHGNYHAVLLDGNLQPGWGIKKPYEPYGKSFIPHIRKQSHNTKVFAVSSEDNHNREMMNLSADGFMNKQLMHLKHLSVA